jgi:hypothetical protein
MAKARKGQDKAITSKTSKAKKIQNTAKQGKAKTRQRKDKPYARQRQGKATK